MSGRRRTGAGLKAFADTLEPILKEKREREFKRQEAQTEREAKRTEREAKRQATQMELELKRKYALEDFDRRLKDNGILRGVSKGTVDPLTFQPITPTPKVLSPSDQAIQERLDLINRLPPTDSVVEGLRRRQAGGFIPGTLEQTLILDELQNALPSSDSQAQPAGLQPQAGGLLSGFSAAGRGIESLLNRLIRPTPGISGPVQAPTAIPQAEPAAAPVQAPTQFPVGVTDSGKQAEIKRLFDWAEASIGQGADRKEVMRRLEELLRNLESR